MWVEGGVTCERRVNKEGRSKRFSSIEGNRIRKKVQNSTCLGEKKKGDGAGKEEKKE